MKLIIGDLHIKKNSIEVCQQILDFASNLATKCELTVFTGDVNDTKATINSPSQNVLLDYLKRWPTPVHVLIGNHDLHTSKDPSAGHSLEALKLIDGVIVIDKPMLIGDSFYVPYVPEDQFFNIKLEDASYLFLHQDMDKAKFSNNMAVKSAIKSTLFKKYKRVIVGHIHMAQEFDNIIYVGTPYTESFKEANESKRLLILNPKTDKIVSVPTKVRKHVSFRYDVTSLEDIKEIKKDVITKFNDTDLVALHLDVPEEIQHKIKKSLFKDIGIQSLKTHKKSSIQENVKITESMSNIDIMEDYLKNSVSINKDLLPNLLELNKEILSSL